jgi:hypothetical protein
VQVEARRHELDAARRRLERLEERTRRLKRVQQARHGELVKNERGARRTMRETAAAERELRARIAGLVRRAQAEAAQRAARTGPTGVRIDPRAVV